MIMYHLLIYLRWSVVLKAAQAKNTDSSKGTISDWYSSDEDLSDSSVYTRTSYDNVVGIEKHYLSKTFLLSTEKNILVRQQPTSTIELSLVSSNNSSYD